MKNYCKYFIFVGLLSTPVLFTLPALAYPAVYFKFRQLGISPSYCVDQAIKTIKGMGLEDFGSNSYSSGGHTNTARAFINCTTLPKVGACGGNGTSVMFVVASDKNSDDATSLLNELDRKFGNPTLFDCNQ